MTSGQPLEGVRVLDLTRLVPGAVCTMHLADFGAEVIKIEEPGRGDYLRWVGDGAPGRSSWLFRSINRNKRSLGLDLKTDDGRNLLFRLAAMADVVVESFRPGVADRHGIGADALRGAYPRLVYASITGYGSNGPMADRAGHDINYLALTGVLDRTGSAASGPVIPGFPVADIVGGGLAAATAILSALFGAQKTGIGCRLDLSMHDGVLAHSVMALAGRMPDGGSPPRGTDRYSGGHAGYAIYQTADGRYLAVGALEQKFWSEFCHRIGCPELSENPEAPDSPERVASIIAEQPMSAWDAAFANADCCVTPVLTPAEAVVSGPTSARNLVGPDGIPRAFAVLDGRRLAIRNPAPELGADGAEILASLGLTDPDLDRLEAAGVVSLPRT